MSASEARFSVHDLKRTPGARREFSFLTGLDEDVRSGLVCLPKDQTIAIVGVLESVGDGVLVTAQATVRVDAECARCLTSFSDRVSVEIHELFVYPEQAKQYEEEDVGFIENERIDLAAVVSDAVILEQPLIPLCDEGCRGLCQLCGADLNRQPGHQH